MSNVNEGTPSTAPDKVKVHFGPRSEQLPEPIRDFITRYAKEVYIERFAVQVSAEERARATRAKELALLGLRAACAGDDEWVPCLACAVYHHDSAFLELWYE
jgi:hypothetical protein